MNILLTGASGFIGQHMMFALINANNQITACCRNPQQLQLRFPAITVLPVDYNDMLDANDWLPHLNAMDVVINAVGIIQDSAHQSFANLHSKAPIALFQACEQANVRRVIHISALGAGSQQKTQYHASKGMADEALQTLSLDWFIFRPSIVYGAGAKSMALFRALAVLPLVPIIGKGDQQIQPVYIDDLVNAILFCVDGNSPSNQIIHAVGPEPIQFIKLIEKLGAWSGKSQVYSCAVPARLIKLFAPLGRWIDEPALNKESIDMLEQGNSADVSQFAKLLGYMPKQLEEVLQTTISTQADRWHARLYFMRPVLRFMIALVWLWAGWVSAFIYPVEGSYQMLDQVGIPQAIHTFVLYGASAMDFSLGVAMLLVWRLRWVVYIQIVVMLTYSVIITATLPEYWSHPFGPMIKNLPLMAATLILLILEEQKP